jgi:tetratricopeptide (TPR) repeat protein
MGDIHITQDMLDAVSRGELPPPVLAEIGLKHLLSLCPHCRGELEAWQRRRNKEERNDSAVRALPILLKHQAQNFDRREDEAKRDFRALQRLSFEDRLGRIRRAQRRFRDQLLAELLLDAARKQIPAEPQTVYELAETAKAVLCRTPTSPTASVLSVRAAIYAGNALRAQGNLQAADKQFAFARSLITATGVTDTVTYAEVDWFEGTLRKDQRRFGDAEELLVRSVTLYRLAGDHAAAVFPLSTLGILFYHRQKYRQALDTLRVALSQIQPETEPRLYCYVHHNLTLTLCDLGDYHAAEEALETGRDSYAACPDSHTQARLAWVEGKIAVGFGHLERAKEALRAVRAVFVTEGNGYDAAMVSLDLGLVYVKQGQVRELKQLAEEMYSIFESQEIHREALAALLLFQQAAREERLTVERVEGFIWYLRKARANPKLRFKEPASSDNHSM